MSHLSETIDVADDFDATIERVTEALKTEGFGVLTRIDIDKAFREKLGVEFRRYAILGACNPRLAHRALSSVAEVGLLLPCNVCVEQTETGTRIRLIDAEKMMAAAGLEESPVIRQLGSEAGERLRRVAEQLRSD